MRSRDLDTVYYFSYGHNTHTPTMRQRAPHAQLVGPAVLHNFQLSFEKFANIENHDGALVHGLLYKMPRSDLKRLDRDERYHEHYARIPLEVHHEDQTYQAFVYIMEPGWDPGDKPTPEYLSQVRDGYRDHGLPQSQINQALGR